MSSVCAICQDQMPLSGPSFWVNQLIPSRHVRTLGCKHEFHSSCFQDMVNRCLATNFNHKGPVPCPQCRGDVESLHSAQHFDNKVPTPFVINFVAATISGGLYGVGFATMIIGNEGATVTRRLLKCVVGLVIIVASKVLSHFYEKKYKNDDVRMGELLIALYNFRFGTHMQRKDLMFGLDIEFSVKELLTDYCSFVPSIAFMLETEEVDEDGDALVEVFSTTVENIDLFVATMEAAINEKPDDVPAIFHDAKKHFRQIIIDERKQGALLGFLTELALEKGVLKIPENRRLSHLNYSALAYEHIHYI
jgi:hypothetical protein